MIFVEVIYNNEWGFGFDCDGICNIKLDYWLGKNVFGVFMKKVVKKVWKRKYSDFGKIDCK